MKVTHKFYVASDSMITNERGWAKETLEEAIEHAHKLLDKEARMGCGHDYKYVVKVIKVVKRKRVEIDVEEVE